MWQAFYDITAYYNVDRQLSCREQQFKTFMNKVLSKT